jgi:hypothetical protein
VLFQKFLRAKMAHFGHSRASGNLGFLSYFPGFRLSRAAAAINPSLEKRGRGDLRSHACGNRIADTGRDYSQS